MGPKFTNFIQILNNETDVVLSGHDLGTVPNQRPIGLDVHVIGQLLAKFQEPTR